MNNHANALSDMTAVVPTKGDDGEGQRHLGEGQRSDCIKHVIARSHQNYIYAPNYLIAAVAGLRVHMHMPRG